MILPRAEGDERCLSYSPQQVGDAVPLSKVPMVEPHFQAQDRDIITTTFLQNSGTGVVKET